MKILLLCAMLFIAPLAQAQYSTKYLQVASTIAELKQKQVGDSTSALVIGLTSVGDGMGSIYYWHPTSTDAEDIAYYNTVVSARTSTGRWKRVSVRTIQLPHGILTMNGGIKTFYSSGTTNSSAELTANLTYEGAATGTPIFTKLLFKETNATNAIVSPNDFIWGGYKSATSDFKQITFKYIKGAAPVSAIVGLLINPVANAPVSTPVEIRVEGQ